MLSFVAAAPAAADPADDTVGTAALATKLEAATRAYNDAKGRLAAAQASQKQLTARAQTTGAELEVLRERVREFAIATYKGGRLGSMNALLASTSPSDFFDRLTMIDVQVRRDNDAVHRMADVKARYDQQLAQIASDIAVQKNQLALMDKHRRDAQAALNAAGGGDPADGPDSGQATADPAPRNSDGSWPKESCSVDDPTTSGCLTPRTLHALKEVQKAGFTRYVSCYRNGSSGEHPKGRACDFSANRTTFVDARATGDDKAYGNRLASWLLSNADRLGVLYVIWYKRIWLPGSGWRSYHGDGTPAGDHYNHVHLSIQ